MRRGNETALGRIIDKYTAYVCTIIRHVIGERMTPEDIEESASDVFLALWENADKLQKENLKAYLGVIARNQAKNKLRGVCENLPLEEEIIASGSITIEDAVIESDEQQAVKTAIFALEAPDREIFLRHYYGAQTVAAIVAETGMTESAVKHRLVRGREKLKFIFDKEGIGK
jgi:RNA polymerase sigma-70 factor (ECF subfamily)